MSATMAPAGEAMLSRIPLGDIDPYAYLEHALPQEGLPDEVNHWRWLNQDHYLESWENVMIASRLGIASFFGTLSVAKVLADGSVLPLGIVGHKVVTTVAAQKIVAFMSKTDVSTGQNWLYHGIGKGTTAEAASQTGLVTELSTEYSTPNTRPAGSQGVTGTENRTYRTSATVAVGTVGSTQVITEHAVFSAASVGSGSMLDRSMFSGSSISLASNEAVAAQYDFTVTAGG